MLPFRNSSFDFTCVRNLILPCEFVVDAATTICLNFTFLRFFSYLALNYSSDYVAYYIIAHVFKYFFLFFISNIIAFDFYWCTLFAFSQKQQRSLSINQFWHCWKCVRHASRQFLSSQRVSCSVRSRVICSRSIRLLCSLAAGGCACQLNQLNVRITCGNVDLLGMGIKKIMRIQIKTKKRVLSYWLC